jgi:hypothetical protein
MIEDSWEKIKNDKDLDMPNYRDMIADLRCEEIMTNAY